MYKVVKVFHAKPEILFDVLKYEFSGPFYDAEKARENFHSGKYEEVDIFFLDPSEHAVVACQTAYDHSQNFDGTVWRPSHPCRSTSVGDIMLTCGELWIVSPCGFDKLEVL